MDEGDGGTVAHPVIALEAAALARWCRGDPSGFLEISDDEVGYFEPFVAERIDGLAALGRHYEALRGRVTAATWEMIAARVVEIGEVAVLSYRFRSAGDGGEMHWQASEVYRRRPQGWRIVHTHWSLLR